MMKVTFVAVFVVIVMAVPLVVGQARQAVPDGVPAEEKKYMPNTNAWKKEIVLWASEYIFEISNKITQTNRIQNQCLDDLRFILATLMGRIYEIHRQQMDMYRRMKKRKENKFNWMKDDLGRNYTYPNGTFLMDYKPHVYITALEYITKREIDIEANMRIVMNYIGEEELNRFKPDMLPAGLTADKSWDSYKTSTVIPGGRRHRESDEDFDPMYLKEEEIKSKMRDNYFKRKA